MLDAPQGMRGAVQFREWNKVPWESRDVKGVVGSVTFHTAKDATGADVTNRESNWLLEIRGSECVYYVPGCQVLGVTWLGEAQGVTNVDYTVVP